MSSGDFAGTGRENQDTDGRCAHGALASASRDIQAVAGSKAPDGAGRGRAPPSHQAPEALAAQGAGAGPVSGRQHFR
eukprot:scaffold2329_cov247-Pinguiococcus_pyrenoidosus.AAC.27